MIMTHIAMICQYNKDEYFERIVVQSAILQPEFKCGNVTTILTSCC